MPTILLKKSDTPGSVPGTANLTNLAGGVEVAVNTADKRMFSMTSASAVIELGTNPSSLTCADASFTVARVGSLTISSLSLTNVVVSSATVTNLTATSASITTLTNNPTLSAGTANGVLYLNGSKVATSGSALTFDGTNLLLASGGRIRNIPSTTTANGLFQASNDGGGFYTGIEDSTGSLFTGSAYAGVVWHTGNRPIAFGVNNAEQMRLTSTGLGIGTSSPAYRLQVQSSGTGTTAASNIVGRFQTNGSGYDVFVQLSDNVANSGGIGMVGGAMYLANGTTRNLTLDSSGNFGLGVTPKAWVTTTTSRAIQFGRSGSLFYSTDNALASFGNNYYQDGANSYKYLEGGYAQRYSQSDFDGDHKWFTAPSGTAGNAISFTQAMTLDASGNLSNGGNYTSTGAGNTRYIGFNFYGNLQYNFYVDGTSDAAAMLIRSGTTERARFTAAGDFLVGTTTAAWAASGRGLVEINGSSSFLFGGKVGGTQTAYFAASSSFAEVATVPSIPLLFTTNNAERARITAGGDFGIGTTSPGARLSVTNSNSTAPTIEMGGTQVREFVRTGSQSSDTTVRVDLTFGSQGSNWHSHIVEITIAAAKGDSSTRYGGVVRYALTSLTDLQGPTALASDLTGLTVSTAFSGMEFRVTFTSSFNIDYYCVYARVVSSGASGICTSMAIN